MLSNLGYKLRLIYLPVLGLGSLLVLLITGCYWLLVLQSALLNPSKDQLMGAVFALSILGQWPLLYARLQLLWRGEKDEWVTFYYIVPMAAVGIAALCVIHYVHASTGQLTSLNNIGELGRQSAPTRFYTLRECHPDPQHAGTHTVFTTSGKNNEKLNFDLYVACPLLLAPNDTTTAPAWLGLTYHHSVSTKLPLEEKEAEYQKFLQRSQQQFSQQNLTKFTYLTRVSGLEDGLEFQRAVQESRLRPAGLAASAVIFQLEQDPFSGRTAKPLRNLAWALGLGWGLYLLMMVFPKVSPTALKQWQRGQGGPGLWTQVQDFLRANSFFRATPVLLLLNSLVYLSMVASLGSFSFQNADLLAWGSSYGPLLQAGEWWRLLTPSFVHGGLLHLVYNVVALGTIGYLIEPKIGSRRLVLTYVIAGVISVLISVAWSPESVSVGASGAVFGLIGVGLGLLRRAPADARGELIGVAVLFGLPGLLLGFLSPVTDNAAHLGGLLGGLLLGLLWTPRQVEGHTQ